MSCRDTVAPRPFTDAARPARLFWAAELDAPAVAFAQAECARLAASLPSPKIRWQPSGNWHLTLFFLGNTTVGQGLATADRLRVPLASIEPFVVTLRDVQWFPSQQHPLVIALESACPPPLRALASVVAEAATACGFAHEPRPFRGHVSLARVKRGYRPRDPLPAAGGTASLHIDHLALYESVPAEGGARYVPMLTLPLRAASR